MAALWDVFMMDAFGTAQHNLIGEAVSIMAIMRQKGGAVPVPVDLVGSKTFGEDASSRIVASDAVADDDVILDVGPCTAAAYSRQLGQAGAIVWNGPFGGFEIDAFVCGTKALGEAVAGSKAFSNASAGRHARCDQPVRTQEPHWLHIYQWRRISGIPRGKILPAAAAL